MPKMRKIFTSIWKMVTILSSGLTKNKRIKLWPLRWEYGNAVPKWRMMSYRMRLKRKSVTVRVRVIHYLNNWKISYKAWCILSLHNAWRSRRLSTILFLQKNLLKHMSRWKSISDNREINKTSLWVSRSEKKRQREKRGLPWFHAALTTHQRKKT